jgi:23S rRNA pseudouridine1911/1915/1917 synthase
MEFLREEPVEPRVVYEDEWLIAVRKPLRMHSAPGLGGGGLCAWVFERYPEIGELEAPQGARKRGEGGLLHRLDYETSGLVLFARKPDAFASLLDQQARGAFYKEYVAVASPSRAASPRGSSPQRGAPSGIDAEQWTEARDALDAERCSELIEEAVSRGSCAVGSAFRSFGLRGSRVACLDSVAAAKGGLYLSEILESESRFVPYGSGKIECIELRVRLARGFRHQVRAHLAWVGLPICGDPLYDGVQDERLRLYAVGLSFAHPVSGLAMALSLEE